MATANKADEKEKLWSRRSLNDITATPIMVEGAREEVLLALVSNKVFHLRKLGLSLSVSFIVRLPGSLWRAGKKEERAKGNWKTLQNSRIQMNLRHDAVCQHSFITSHKNVFAKSHN